MFGKRTRISRGLRQRLSAQAAAQLLGVYVADEDLFARLGCSADDLHLSGAELELFSEEFEQGFVGGPFFGGGGNGYLQGFPQRADDAITAGAGHDLDRESTATRRIGDS